MLETVINNCYYRGTTQIDFRILPNVVHLLPYTFDICRIDNGYGSRWHLLLFQPSLKSPFNISTILFSTNQQLSETISYIYYSFSQVSLYNNRYKNSFVLFYSTIIDSFQIVNTKFVKGLNDYETGYALSYQRRLS